MALDGKGRLAWPPRLDGDGMSDHERAVLQQWADRLPLDMFARGLIAQSTTSTTVSGITAATDLGPSVTFVPERGRQYRARGVCRLTQAAATGVPELYITNGTGTLIQKSSTTLTAGSTHTFAVDTDPTWTPTPGTAITVKLQATVGAGTVGSTLSATQVAWIAVYDDGPI